MQTALVCFAKNEDNYIDEWLDYHFKLGFNKIFLYQNDWRYHGKHVNNEFLHLIEYDGIAKQVEAYNHFVRTQRNEIDWTGFIDADEFIVLVQKNNITEFLSDYNEFDALGLNWDIFGSNGLVFNGNYSVIRRFTKCNKKLSPTIKCLVNLNKTKGNVYFKTMHYIEGFNRIISVDKTHFINGYPDTPNSNYRNFAYLNHYYTKTKQEWQAKMNRGLMGTSGRRLSPEDQKKLWDERNTPEYDNYEDLVAYNFMYTSARRPLPSGEGS